MNAAAASAIEAEYGFNGHDFEHLVIGLLDGAVSAAIPNVGTCIEDASGLGNEVISAYNDFHSGGLRGFKRGIGQIGHMVGELYSDVKDCGGEGVITEDLLEMASNFDNPWSFVFHVGEDLIVNGVHIFDEIKDAIHQYEVRNW